jgi:hypothetical protein
MARGTKVKTGRTRVPVREEKRPVATAAQPAGFDMPRAQPPRFSDFEADTELSNALAAFEPEAVEPEQEAEELGYTPTTYTQTISSQDYGSAPTYETADEALSHYNALLEEVQQQQAQTASVYNYNNYDPGDFARAGFSGPSSVGGQAAADRIAKYLRENDIPPSIEVDGQTLYFTTGVGENALAQTLGDDYSASGSYQSYGPAGTYSTVYTPPESVFAGINPYLRAALSVATGGLSEGFISATNIISGDADASDFINVALSGVNIAQQPGSGGFTASSGSPITGGATEAGLSFGGVPVDIVGAGAGLGGIAEEEDDDDLAAVIAAIEANRDFETGVTDPVTGEVVDVTGVTPETPPTPAPVITPEIVTEPIVADPIEVVIPPPVIPTEDEEAPAPAPAPAPVAPPATPAEGESFEYDADAFEDVFGDTWLDADFGTLDVNNDGIVTAEEMDEYERKSLEEEQEPPIYIPPSEPQPPTPSPAPANGVDGTDGTNGTDGTDGTDGERGERGRRGSQGAPGVSATRTTDSLFGDMLKLETQVGSTQELVPFSLLPTPELMPYQYEQQRPLEQFTQPRMLTNDSGLQINLPPRQLTQEEMLQQWLDSQKVSL